MSHKVYLRGEIDKQALDPDGSWVSLLLGWLLLGSLPGKGKPKDVHGLRSALVSRCHKSPSVNRSPVNSGPWEGSKDQSALKADLE